jgi:transposase
MLPRNIITEIVNLPLEKLKYISCKKKFFNEKVIIEISFRGKGKYKKCSCCGQKTKRREDQSWYVQKDIRHQIHFSYEIRLRLLKRRFYCTKCKSRFIEPFDFIPKKIKAAKEIGERDRSKGHTKHFEEYILFEWHHLSVAEIARRCSVSEYRIWNIIADIDTEGLLQKGIQIMLKQAGDLYLGIDEHSFSGRDMVLVITEHSSKKVVAVLPNTTKETLKKWLNNLPPSVMVRIKGLTIDMTGAYKDTVLETLGVRIVAIVDKYHIIQMANRALDEVRQMNKWMVHMGIYGHDIIDLRQKKGIKKINKKGHSKGRRVSLKNYPKYRPRINNKKVDIRLYKPNYKGYQSITVQHYLAQTYRTLFLKRQEDLTEKQKHRLNQILIEFDPLGYVCDAYTAKEMITEMMEDKDKEQLEDLLYFLKDSEHYKLQELYRSLKKWKQEILNYFEHGKTNARNEGYNNKAKIIKRISYGYKTKKNYIKKLMFAL